MPMTAVRSCGGLPSGESTLQITRITAFCNVYTLLRAETRDLAKLAEAKTLKQPD
ncbi:MAG: hypothetical protein ACXV8Q_16595 [Methylobacter sp.]